MEVPLSENPTDPNPTDTVTAATATGEKMIPLSAVEPLLKHLAGEIAWNRTTAHLTALYGDLAQVVGATSPHALVCGATFSLQR